MSSSIDRKIAASKARQDAAEKQAQVQDVNGRMRTNIPGNEAANPVGTLTRKDADKTTVTTTPWKFDEGCHVMHMGTGKTVVHAAVIQEPLPADTVVSCTYNGKDRVFRFKLPGGVINYRMAVTHGECSSREWLVAIFARPHTTKYDEAVRTHVLESLGIVSRVEPAVQFRSLYKPQAEKIGKVLDSVEKTLKASDFTVGAPELVRPDVNGVSPYMCQSAYTPDDFLTIDTSKLDSYSGKIRFLETGVYYQDPGPNYSHTPAVSAEDKRAEFVREHNNEIMHWLRDNDPSLKTVDDMLQAMSILAKEMIKHTAEVYEEGRSAGVLAQMWSRK